MPRLPKPLVPADVDLRHFSKMPLDITALMNSDTWLMADGWTAKAMVNLWMRAWQQVPAGSLPDNDAALATFAGVPNWTEVREIALRNFVKCSDGRLYHTTLCELVMGAFETSRKRQEAAKSRWGKRKPRPAKAEQLDMQMQSKSTARDDAKAMQGKGIEENNPPTPLEGGDFDAFWSAYPRKVGKDAAKRKYKTVVNRGDAGHGEIMAGLRRYVSACKGKDEQYIAHPTTWLNQGRWADEQPGQPNGQAAADHRTEEEKRMWVLRSRLWKAGHRDVAQRLETALKRADGTAPAVAQELAHAFGMLEILDEAPSDRP